MSASGTPPSLRALHLPQPPPAPAAAAPVGSHPDRTQVLPRHLRHNVATPG